MKVLETGWKWSAFAAVALLVGCSGGGDESTGRTSGAAAERPNVVLLIGDTFRADKLSSQGGRPGLTPFLDALAAEGARFEKARSHAPWTLPSTASLLTSLHPLEHGAGGRVPNFTKLSEDVSTIAARFRESGYDTHAVVNVHFLDPRAFGVTRDFESVDNVSFESNVDVRPADATTTAALKWLDAREDSSRPFFLLVHYFDPHCVYAPPELQRKAWALPEDRESAWTFGTREQMIQIRRGDLVADEETLRRAEALYDGEIAYLDAQLARLNDGLLARVRPDRLVTVFTSDHGEEFYDHEGFEHGHTLFDELVRVPLLIRAHGRVPAGAVVPHPVRHIDVAPTLCELADIALDEQYMGQSLLPLAAAPDEVHTDRGTLAHGNFWTTPLSSWTRDGWKLLEIERPDAEVEYRLYHVAADPLELVNVAGREPERLAEMRTELETVRIGLRALQSGEAAALSERERERLRGLGYFE
ncbi:MAG: sulfatase [Planctomycetota bacterium]